MCTVPNGFHCDIFMHAHRKKALLDTHMVAISCRLHSFVSVLGFVVAVVTLSTACMCEGHALVYPMVF